MRLTIERMRTLIVVAGALLLSALGIFLAIGKWRHSINPADLPKILGVDVTQEANGVTFTHAFGDHSQFKIHASKVVQLKAGYAQLHDVQIELYGEDGSRVDRIEGTEFDYDQSKGLAHADGEVEITLMKPGEAPAIDPKARAGALEAEKNSVLANAAKTAAAGTVHVKTSGLTFDQKSGIATTDRHVEFVLTEGAGSSMGATYDSQQGHLILDRAVELHVKRGAEPIDLHAQHAEFERGDMNCHLRAATADYQGGEATAGEATILFRENGAAERLDARNGFTLATAAGSHLASPVGEMTFDTENHPLHGHMEGGVALDSISAASNRQVHGTAPAMDLDFAQQGELRHAHLERGVEFISTEQSPSPQGELRLNRRWRSPVADLEFRSVADPKTGRMETELSGIHGAGGVVVESESRRGKAAAIPSKLTADDLTGEFAPGQVLRKLTGSGHAGLVDTTETGTVQTGTGDRLEVHLLPSPGGTKPALGPSEGPAQIESATLEGHVLLVQTQPARPGAAATAPMRATASRADYEGDGQWLHLTGSPRVQNGDLEMSADKIDLSRATGQAFAHGNVKATWLNSAAKPQQKQDGGILGGNGPAHVVAAEAEMNQQTGETTFRGAARLWQLGNSIAAPVLVLNRQKQSLAAHATEVANPVRAVLVNANQKAANSAPAVIRVRGGEFFYSDAERRALMQSGSIGPVVAETPSANSTSDQVELFLVPAAGKTGSEQPVRQAIPNASATGGVSQVDRMIARGHVILISQTRRATGEEMVYTGQTGDYVLTGTAAVPPQMTDPLHGKVTGEALIFHSRDGSVSIEGGGHRTTTQTHTPK